MRQLCFSRFFVFGAGISIFSLQKAKLKLFLPVFPYSRNECGAFTIQFPYFLRSFFACIESVRNLFLLVLCRLAFFAQNFPDSFIFVSSFSIASFSYLTFGRAILLLPPSECSRNIFFIWYAHPCTVCTLFPQFFERQIKIFVIIITIVAPTVATRMTPTVAVVANGIHKYILSTHT